MRENEASGARRMRARDTVTASNSFAARGRRGPLRASGSASAPGVLAAVGHARSLDVCVDSSSHFIDVRICGEP